MQATIDLQQNLSEVLFKPQRSSLETSLISNSGCALPEIDYKEQGLGFMPHWYRPLNRFYWAWLGANPLDVEEALANIAASHNPRSREQCLDTVSEYGPGNWIYEFNTIAQKRVNLAAESQDPQQKAHHYRIASRYFAIAAFPNLKGDELAAQSSLLCRRYYREFFASDPGCGYYSEEHFTYKGNKITAYLHSPDNQRLHPCVVVVGSYEQSCTDFYRLFDYFFRELDMAVLVLEMPGVGNCAALKLEPECSDYLKQALLHLNSLPFIDGSNIGIFARGVAAMAALRLCVLEPGLVKAAAVMNPLIDSVYVNPKVLANVPLCLRSSLANRMDFDASSWDTVIPRIQILSLKKQGLLNGSLRSSPPLYCVYIKNLEVLSEDVKLIGRSFKQAEFMEQSDGSFNQSSFMALKNVVNFFKEKFN